MRPTSAASTKWFAQNYSADSCPCSLGGCQSLWPCTPSPLCWEHDPPGDSDALARETHSPAHGATFLLFLAFNSSLVRNSFQAHPKRAREREISRVLWFAHTARTVRTRLPIHVVVACEALDSNQVARLEQAGVRLLEGPMVPTPAWASKWHRLSL